MIKVKVFVTQSCPTLCNHMNCSTPGFSVNGLLQARILEWVAIPFSMVTSQASNQTWDYNIASRSIPTWSHQGILLINYKLPVYNMYTDITTKRWKIKRRFDAKLCSWFC